jgi:hypothetical protein
MIRIARAFSGYPVTFSIQTKNLRRRQWPRRRAFPRTTARIPTRQSLSVLEDQEKHSRKAAQKLIGHVPWEYQPLLATLADQVGAAWGEPDAVLMFDPLAFPTKGTTSMSVAR